jgi:tetratricopeptide (TPR) repeat protein
VVDPADSGLVFFKMATAYDELRDLKNSLRCAKLYLNVCRQMGDSVGEALACNDLGRFIAYLNLGHAYREMGMPSQSKESTQKALECAQRAYSAFGESIACAQLGQTMRMVGDPEACSNFLEKWLELSESMHDQDSEASAWKALGSLQQDSHKHQDAAECYTHAYELALSRHDVPQTDYARALVGITKGDQELERRMQMAGMNLRREVGH